MIKGHSRPSPFLQVPENQSLPTVNADPHQSEALKFNPHRRKVTWFCSKSANRDVIQLVDSFAGKNMGFSVDGALEQFVNTTIVIEIPTKYALTSFLLMYYKAATVAGMPVRSRCKPKDEKAILMKYSPRQ